ncbi:MAG: ribokinase [Actinomycetota bacterium]|nr:ribokinase [Actinomycetota bacterium]
MSARGPVMVVGSINADFVISVPRIPQQGETVGDGEFAQHWGGKSANQAVVAARYGAAVAMVGAVGDDDLGSAAVVALEDEGIDVERVTLIPATATGIAVIMVDPGGRNIIAVAPGANARIDPAGIDDAIAAHAGAVLTCFEVADPVVMAAVTAGIHHGADVIVNPAPARPLPDQLQGSKAMLTPNEHEARTITGLRDPVAAASRLSEWTQAPAIVTLGAHGAVMCSTVEQPLRIAAPSVVPVDTTGAGDTFNGTLAAALAEGLDLPSCVQRAVTAASLSVRGRGARGSLPSREDIDDFLRDHPGGLPETRHPFPEGRAPINHAHAKPEGQ